jgi:hypothetical protein
MNENDQHTRFLLAQDYTEYRAIVTYLDRVKKRQ